MTVHLVSCEGTVTDDLCAEIRQAFPFVWMAYQDLVRKVDDTSELAGHVQLCMFSKIDLSFASLFGVRTGTEPDMDAVRAGLNELNAYLDDAHCMISVRIPASFAGMDEEQTLAMVKDTLTSDRLRIELWRKAKNAKPVQYPAGGIRCGSMEYRFLERRFHTRDLTSGIKDDPRRVYINRKELGNAAHVH